MTRMKAPHPQYPDISDILARKRRGRRELAALSFGEKLALLDALKERVDPIRRARERRKQQLQSILKHG